MLFITNIKHTKTNCINYTTIYNTKATVAKQPKQMQLKNYI